MTTAAQKLDPAGISAEKLLRMYRQMTAIRLFEEQVNELYTRALMPGLAHLYTGEEAVAVGGTGRRGNEEGKQQGCEETAHGWCSCG